MNIFYLKINRYSAIFIPYFQHWLDIIQQFDDVKVFVVCDKPEITEFIKNNYHGNFNLEFIESDKSSEDAMYIMNNAVVKSWRNAGYSHLTTFLHAKANGYKNFWNIDADDTCFCIEPQRVAEILNAVQDYAQKMILKFSL